MMRSKYIAVLIAFCMLITFVSAQPYTIRANRGLNLRTAPSLDAAVADTVVTGTLLNVVGQVNRWLKIDRNGREVWLADWTDYSRVESGATEQAGSQPASSAPANVDNCCFVDRQCQSEKEWSDGYWAFQNGQCAAPAQPQPQPQTSAAPAGNVPANVDNCCFVDRQCATDQEWSDGYWAFQNGQCVAPAETVSQPAISVPATGGNCCSLGWQCYDENERAQGYWAYQINQCTGLPQTSAVTLTGPVPRIEGSSRFVGHITATLKFMKSVAPAWYNYVITAMDSIVEVPVPGWKSGEACTMLAYDRERKVTVESCWIDLNGLGVPEFEQVDTATVLGHEACHIHTHEEGKHFATQEDEELECGKFATGGGALYSGALALVSPRGFGTHYFDKDRTLGLLRQYCSQGYRADLFCPTLQRLEGLWRNVPYSVFPPGAPEW